jgi:hypothetical protein
MKILLLTVLFFTTISMSAHAGSADVFFGYSFADEFDIDSGDREAESSLVLGARYKDQVKKGFGWNVGLGLDTIRDLDGSSAELGFMLVEGNATLTIDQVHNALYIFAGLNYPLIIYEDKGLSDVDPVFGVQFGTGFEFTNQVGMELAFRTANFEFGTADANLWGFLIRGYYTFAGF